MDGFFIGQRVRILHNPAHPHHDGQPARIVGRVTRVRRRDEPIGADTHWLVAPESPDGRPPSRLSRTFVIAVAHLEPCAPEGMAPARWDDCAWRPERVPELVAIPRTVGAQQRVLRALARRFGR